MTKVLRIGGVQLCREHAAEVYGDWLWEDMEKYPGSPAFAGQLVEGLCDRDHPGWPVSLGYASYNDALVNAALFLGAYHALNRSSGLPGSQAHIDKRGRHKAYQIIGAAGLTVNEWKKEIGLMQEAAKARIEQGGI
jgi:hypothetical protein